MLRFVRFAAAVSAIPFAWALCRTFVDAVCMSSEGLGRSFTVESVSLFAGIVSFLAFRRVLPDMTRMYVLGHELTHALWGLAFGARVSKLRASSRGGSVVLSKSNVWITLAPYFFPFWTAVVAVFALAVHAAMHFACPDSRFPLPWLWMFAVGFTWCFHACFTIRSLMETQPDVMEYGRVFSWTLILVCNMAGMLVWIICAADVPAAAVADCLALRVSSAYSATFSACRCCVSRFVE